MGAFKVPAEAWHDLSKAAGITGDDLDTTIVRAADMWAKMLRAAEAGRPLTFFTFVAAGHPYQVEVRRIEAAT